MLQPPLIAKLRIFKKTRLQVATPPPPIKDLVPGCVRCPFFFESGHHGREAQGAPVALPPRPDHNPSGPAAAAAARADSVGRGCELGQGQVQGGRLAGAMGEDKPEARATFVLGENDLPQGQFAMGVADFTALPHQVAGAVTGQKRGCWIP